MTTTDQEFIDDAFEDVTNALSVMTPRERARFISMLVYDFDVFNNAQLSQSVMQEIRDAHAIGDSDDEDYEFQVVAYNDTRFARDVCTTYDEAQSVLNAMSEDERKHYSIVCVARASFDE